MLYMDYQFDNLIPTYMYLLIIQLGVSTMLGL